ncbi:YceI family protein [Snuella sedimenti]|uniref:YceI family protein n=1 Tax=Snuella sedimenti TaxID=2798802 RepID=A0A8J7IY90_9FLAO|nr:YceI family protein [Snuella sedimenti]MBJ6368765.1 YceI family protein [Snuella sedimenti]
MREFKNISSGIWSLLVTFLFITQVSAQEFSLINGESSLTVFGTSSLHDWHIEAEAQSGSIEFRDASNCVIKACRVKIVSESLKSGKRSMDKNTFKALKTDDYPNVLFQLVEVKELEDKGNGKFKVRTIGDLTITGVKKRLDLDFIVEITDEKVSLTGEKNIKMTDFNIDPPTALFGTITTGNDLTIKFTTIFR